MGKTKSHEITAVATNARPTRLSQCRVKTNHTGRFVAADMGWDYIAGDRQIAHSTFISGITRHVPAEACLEGIPNTPDNLLALPGLAAGRWTVKLWHWRTVSLTGSRPTVVSMPR